VSGKNGSGKNGTSNNGTSKNGTSNNGTSGKVGKNDKFSIIMRVWQGILGLEFGKI